MPTYLAPGIYVEERSSGTKPIAGVGTSVAAFIGIAEKGPVNSATLVTSFSELVKRFGGPIRIVVGVQEQYLYYSVRHFFASGGTRCYIVRVTNGTDTLASVPLAGRDDTGSVAGALTVSAINSGAWGDDIGVAVRATSQFSLLLMQNVTAGSTGPIILEPSDDLRVGTLLWLVDEVSGVVEGVTGTDVTFETGVTLPAVGSRAYTPDLLLSTTTARAPSGLTVALTEVDKSDGEPLRPGDRVNFAVAEAIVVVGNISETQVTVGTDTVPALSVTLAGAPPPTLPALPAATSRAYQRGFSLTALDADGAAVETHENLSLVDADLVNHVGVRLPSEEGKSFYIQATDGAAADEVLMENTGTVTLGSGTGGTDGIPAMSPAATFDAVFVGDGVQTGLHALDPVSDASILCVTHPSATVANQALGYCASRGSMIMIVDPPPDETAPADVVDYVANTLNSSQYGALYYPWIQITDPFTGRRVSVPPSGAIAGIYARTDDKRGVHKAPAGLDVGRVQVALSVDRILSKADNATLHGGRVNAVRAFSEGIVVWGTRTLSADAEWSYVNVRRLFIFLEQSIEQGTQWAAFEPNDPSLWKKLERNISAFLRVQWLDGKLAGNTQEEAFFVRCNAETNPPEVVEQGQVVTEIGVAPLKPAEFVVFRLKQIAGGFE